MHFLKFNVTTFQYFSTSTFTLYTKKCQFNCRSVHLLVLKILHYFYLQPLNNNITYLYYSEIDNKITVIINFSILNHNFLLQRERERERGRRREMVEKRFLPQDCVG